MEWSCMQTRWLLAQAADGCSRAGQVPSTVKGNISANVGTRCRGDLVSSPKRNQVAAKGRERCITSLLCGWNGEINKVITLSAGWVNPGPSAYPILHAQAGSTDPMALGRMSSLLLVPLVKIIMHSAPTSAPQGPQGS